MPQRYADFPTVTHSLDGFTERLNILYNEGHYDDFIKTALTGQYRNQSGRERQVFIDPLLNRVEGSDALKFTRDYDSVIGLSNDILVEGPVTLHAIPHPTFALTTSIHLKFHIPQPDGRTESVEFHRIPNFELGTFGPRNQLHVFFPRLWSRDRASRSHLTQGERSFFYMHGLRPAIGRLQGEEVVSQWPASVEAEEIRACKKTGKHSYGSRVVSESAVGGLMECIRDTLINNRRLPPDSVAWASDCFVLHTIRGIKHGYLHSPGFFDAASHLAKVFSDASLPLDAHLIGDWYVDVGIEISSEEGHCLQWITASHWKVVQNTLQIEERVAKCATSIASNKYSRDLSSHLTAISGFRIAPGPRSTGRFKAAYIQAYTTDKTVVYNPEGIHHAKFISAKDALGAEQPSKRLDGIHTIYEQARDSNGSNARLEVRVPYKFATDVLIDLNEALFRDALCSFTRDTWWNFRIIRLMAISQTFCLQEDGPSSMRFTPDALLLTAACLWLANSLHARHEDGPASRNLMRAVLPLTDESEVIRDVLAYNARVRPELREDEEEEEAPTGANVQVPYNPYGMVFFRTIMLGADKVDVPRFCCYGPCISPPSFKFFFDGMTLEEVEAKFKRTGIVSRETIARIRPMNKKSNLTYINTTEAPEPILFELGGHGHSLQAPARDEGSDLEASPPPEDRTGDIDVQMSNLWRQFVMDITYKAPNKKGMTSPSHVRLTTEERRSGSEEPYKTLHLSKIFNAVWYKNATGDQWKLCFNWLFPAIGRRVTSNVQNYGSCKYYKTWLELLENNKEKEDVIEAIRTEFFKRIRKWRWIPFAQSDRIWMTSVKKPSGNSFQRWPPSDDRTAPGAFILLHSHDVPIFTVEEGSGEMVEAI